LSAIAIVGSAAGFREALMTRALVLAAPARGQKRDPRNSARALEPGGLLRRHARTIAFRSYSKWGGFLDDIASFDPAFFGLSRRWRSHGPQQRILLKVA
jgi:acyl transferase domain-containing protein